MAFDGQTCIFIHNVNVAQQIVVEINKQTNQLYEFNAYKLFKGSEEHKNSLIGPW